MGRKVQKNLWSATGSRTRILFLYDKGLTHQKIADTIGMERKWVTTIINTPEFIERYKKLHEGAKEKILNVFASKGIKSARKIVELMEKGTSKERLQFEAAKEILYQMGIKPKEVIEETIKREYTPDEISSALSTMNEIEAIANRMDDKKSKFLVPKSNSPEITDEAIKKLTDG